MARAARSCSSSKLPCVAALAFLLAGCATSAPTLPPDTTSIGRSHDATLADFSDSDRALSCEQIAAERRTIADGMAADNSQIEGNRTRNEVAGYLGALFIAPALAMENNSAEKDDIAKLYARHDMLIKLAAVKRCPSPP